jgi:hypothetical protein
VCLDVNEDRIGKSTNPRIAKWIEQPLRESCAWLNVDALNPETQERMHRPNAQLYAEIARTNAIAEEMVENNAPQVKDQVF